MQMLAALSILIILTAQIPAYPQVGGKKTMYVVGTANVPEETEGESSTKDEKAFIFEYKGGRLTIQYDKIKSLVYGQTADRQIVSPIPFSKKRKHYLTITFLDESGKEQGCAFEIGKDIVQATLTSLEARTGRKVQYQGDEARKHAKAH